MINDGILIELTTVATKLEKLSIEELVEALDELPEVLSRLDRDQT
jgi:H2-forming N5,N10-methylenetetrahydromethanopterin dehydrogenase-like enzyme